MSHKKLPTLKDRYHLGCLGFYEMERVKSCFFGGLDIRKVISSGDLYSGRLTKQLIVGNFYHDVMEKALLVNEKSELIRFGKRLIAEIESDYVEYVRERKLGRVESWADITNALRASILLFSSRGTRNEEVSTLKKKKLVSLDGRFKGVPDFYKVDGEKGLLIEYKSANLLRDSKTKQEYLDQIDFYSTLLFDSYLELQTLEATVISLKGQKTTKSITRLDAQKISKKLQNEYCNLENTTNIYNYDLDNCTFCGKKEICQVYIREITSVKTDKDIYVLEGRLKRIDKSHEGTLYYFDKFVIKSKESSLDLEKDREYVFNNLYRVTEYYVWGVNSHVYEKN